jgi:hypothetical protein
MEAAKVLGPIAVEIGSGMLLFKVRSVRCAMKHRVNQIDVSAALLFGAVLVRLSRDAFELGLYDRNEMPDGGR